MSRARPWTLETGETVWIDQSRQRATVQELEILADYEGVDLDDLLDEGLSSRQALFRIRVASDLGLIPEHVLERRRARREMAHRTPVCRICALNGQKCEGGVTRHHFVPRWLMLMLENYQAYAARSVCTVPICTAQHRDLHYRSDDPSQDGPKSIVPYLREHERDFAQKLLDELKDQIPESRWDLLVGGDEHSYEGQLFRDYLQGKFRHQDDVYSLEEYIAV